MDLIFDVLIPQKDIDKLSVEEMFAEWGGDIFSQDPRKFKYQTTLYFEEHNNLKYYENILRTDLSQYDFMALTLRGESLSDLEFTVNRNESCAKQDNELIDFIHELYEAIDAFYIILLLNEDQIDEQYNIANVQEAINVFIKSLNWESPKGIIISKGIRIL